MEGGEVKVKQFMQTGTLQVAKALLRPAQGDGHCSEQGQSSAPELGSASVIDAGFSFLFSSS